MPSKWKPVTSSCIQPKQQYPGIREKQTNTGAVLNLALKWTLNKLNKNWDTWSANQGNKDPHYHTEVEQVAWRDFFLQRFKRYVHLRLLDMQLHLDIFPNPVEKDKNDLRVFDHY